MMIILSALAVLSLVKVSVETPVMDNSQTHYCSADVRYDKRELHVERTRTCTQGSIKVERVKSNLADRKAQ